ncbi:ChbG/HpnK family deacetylase [Butyrivibrio sp. YAB3001]|uniref:ChbG/HpnK family deacetylase n=1 Tax=Butyrivibrio sp. YAB3001 TaxID=1520812 RepID=UPI0008F63C85|nr:ChbG/HpnK family deacetylase [Butyrivibrio sp. YAB3001]SFC92638.1 Predicted glycoside hydrolase or deacetylase ChbG, UPF0249 family [Butyrivibrio sp. YAB3001]
MIEFHADDYGMFPAQSKRIIDCIDNGAINSVSVMPNSPYLDECMNMLKGKKVLITVHLNLVQGKPLTDCKLLAPNGEFDISFGKLLVISYLPFLRKKYREEIKKEYIAQIRSVQKYLDNQHFRLDSHWHYHMLPIAFDAMMDAVKETKIDVEYIRLPADRISFFFKGKNRERIIPINIVKVLILNTFRLRARRKYGKYLNNLEKKDFFGVMYSGNMNKINTRFILENILPGKDYEILFHPGSVLEENDIANLTNPGDKEFLTSPKRKAEADATTSVCLEF